MVLEEKKHITVGQAAYDLLKKDEKPVKVQELQTSMQEDYMKNLMACVDRYYPKYPGDFYVVVITKKERLMENVLRNYFYGRQSCPTPDYDQSVFRYNRNKGAIEYLWTIPSKDACLLYLQNPKAVPSEEHSLLEFVIKFENGTLYKLAKKFNGEAPDSPLLVN